MASYRAEVEAINERAVNPTAWVPREAYDEAMAIVRRHEAAGLRLGALLSERLGAREALALMLRAALESLDA